MYGVMKEQVFCVIPEGVQLDGHFDCLELMKAIYGLKQASRVWNETFDEFARSIGFQVSTFDPCIYIMTVEGHCVLVLVYVNDVLLTGSSLELIACTKCIRAPTASRNRALILVATLLETSWELTSTGVRIEGEY